MECNYCKIDPGVKGIVWNGFQDQDNGIYCCNNCKSQHYKEKFKTKLRGLFSEVPVIIK